MTAIEDPWTRCAALAARWRSPGWSGSIREEFGSFGLALDDPPSARSAVRSALALRPGLVADWRAYGADRRGAPAPAISGTTVSSFQPDASPPEVDVVHHVDEVAAVADYVVREAFWVLAGRRIVPDRDEGQSSSRGDGA